MDLRCCWKKLWYSQNLFTCVFNKHFPHFHLFIFFPCGEKMKSVFVLPGIHLQYKNKIEYAFHILHSLLEESQILGKAMYYSEENTNLRHQLLFIFQVISCPMLVLRVYFIENQSKSRSYSLSWTQIWISMNNENSIKEKICLCLFDLILS